MNGKLYLIPTVLAEGTAASMLAPVVKATVGALTMFLCENIRTARRFVSELKVHATVESLQFEILDKETSPEQLDALLKPLLDGNDVGLLSESGCPAIADPGALAVAYAHRHGVQVVPLPGPSSILLALMASGLNGQQFAFHGYLPIESREVGERIKQLERESREKNQTQLFIETPYRNNKLLGHLLKYLRSDTTLCVAADLTSANEFISSRPVSEWKTEVPVLEKVPTTFLFLARGK